MKTSSEYRAQARAVLSGKWTTPVVATLIFLLIGGLLNVISGPIAEAIMGPKLAVVPNLLLTCLVTLPLSYGFVICFLNFLREGGQDIPFETLFSGFKDYKRIVSTLLLMTIYIALWSLLLLIPGIIKAYSYVMTPFILKDHPEMSNNEAIELSMSMMEGHKMDYFILQLSFIGWCLLTILTLGIGLLWVEPWMETAQAAFYEDLKAEYQAAL